MLCTEVVSKFRTSSNLVDNKICHLDDLEPIFIIRLRTKGWIMYVE